MRVQGAGAKPTEVCCNVRWRGHGGLVSGGGGVGAERGDDDEAKVTAGVERGAEDGGPRWRSRRAQGRATRRWRLGWKADDGREVGQDERQRYRVGGGTRKCGRPHYILNRSRIKYEVGGAIKQPIMFPVLLHVTDGSYATCWVSPLTTNTLSQNTHINVRYV